MHTAERMTDRQFDDEMAQVTRPVMMQPEWSWKKKPTVGPGHRGPTKHGRAGPFKIR
jgi:hypothetical protein